MTKLYVQGSVFPALDHQLRQVQDRIHTAHLLLGKITMQGVPSGISRYEVDVLVRRCWQMKNKIYALNGFFVQSAAAYEQVEQQIQRRAGHIANATTASLIQEMSHSIQTMTTLLKPHSPTAKSALRYGEWHTEWWDATHDFHYVGLRNQSLRSLLQNGLRGSGEVGIHIANISRWSRHNQVLDHIAIQVGNAQISGNVQGKLFDKQRFDPQVQAELSAKASLLHGIIERNWSNEVMGAGIAVSGDVGVAEAKGKAVIRKDELTLEGEVGVAALQGEVKGTIEVLGTRITVTAEGEAGSLGIGSEFSASSHSMEIGGKFSCLFGVGLNIKVDW